MVYKFLNAVNGCLGCLLNNYVGILPKIAIIYSAMMIVT